MGGKWFKQFEALIWAVSIGVSIVVYAYGAFATKEFVNQKVELMNTKHESAVSLLKEIREDVKDIKKDIYRVSK